MNKFMMAWKVENDFGFNVKVVLSGYHSPFRMGGSPAAWNGPTPDEPEEFNVETLRLCGKTRLLDIPSGHRLWDYLDYKKIEERFFG